MSSNDSEFFVGWRGHAPPLMGSWLRRVGVALGLVALGAAGLLAALQRTIGVATWDYGVEREFMGVLLADPVPMLLLDAPEPRSGATLVLLVRPSKVGFEPDTARRLDGERVRLRATLLHRNGHAMLEVKPESVAPVDVSTWASALPAWVDLGEHVLAGEIVDSKCFLGAMNPGILKPHRACAILCLSGEIPAILVSRDPTGRAVLYVLAGVDGESIGHDVLDFVAEPVEIRGRVQRRGEQMVLRVQSGTIQRLP